MTLLWPLVIDSSSSSLHLRAESSTLDRSFTRSNVTCPLGPPLCRTRQGCNFKGRASRYFLSQGISVTAARAWQSGIRRPGYGSRWPTCLDKAGVARQRVGPTSSRMAPRECTILYKLLLLPLPLQLLILLLSLEVIEVINVVSELHRTAPTETETLGATAPRQQSTLWTWNRGPPGQCNMHMHYRPSEVYTLF